MSKFANVETPKANKPIPVKQWTALDGITHDFTDSQAYRDYCLVKYGQYMGTDGIRVTK
jgi:hypothetical protein